MQNKPTKPEKTISLSNLPSIIIAVVLIVGIGAVYGLLGYLFSGIKENVTPAMQNSIQKPSMEITNNYFGNEFIQVKSSQKNATIKNPVLISGKANVNEANVRVRILDNNKNILADDFITAGGWIDKLYSFTKEIDYRMPQTEKGLIEIFEESAKDGSDLYKVKIPVVFEEYENAFSDWKVYRNEEFGFEVKYPEYFGISEKNNIISLINFYDSSQKIEILKSSGPPPEIINMKEIKKESVIIDGFTVNKILMQGELENNQNEYYLKVFIPEKSIFYHTDFRKENLENLPIVFDQILSTFKFIEKDETADWQTYRNEEFGFEFKYPKWWKQFTDFATDFPEEFQKGDRWLAHAMVYNGKYNSLLYGDGPGPGNLNFKVPQAAIDSGNLGDDTTFPVIRKSPSEYELLCSEKQIITRDDGIKIETCDFRVYQGEIRDYSIKPFCIQDATKRSCIFLYTTTQLNEMTDYRWDQFKPYVGFDINKQLEREYKNVSDQILSTFKFIEEDETANENKPSIYPSKGRGNLLLLNGEKTGFPAYEFEKENIILFQEEIYDEEKSQNHYSLKAISTISPYEIKTLIDDRHTNCMDNGRFLGEKNDVYFFETEVGAPGSYYELFLFNPVNMDFVLIENLHHYKGYHLISLYSSVSKVSFNIEKRDRISYTGEILLPNDNDIEIIFNEKSFTKKEVDQEKADYIKDIFNYNFAPISTDEINNKESNDSVDACLKYFPEKIPYFINKRYNDKEIMEDFWANPDGYFDFEKNEFISSSNL